MEMKLFDSELKVMGVLWNEGDVPAKHIAEQLTGELGWNKNTTYTLIKRCIKKGAIERTSDRIFFGELWLSGHSGLDHSSGAAVD